MLEKNLYDSWQSRMELYMKNIEHGRKILESVKNGPLIWPTIKENGVTTTKKYEELSATERIQADCDVKATNIILQGLPSDVFALFNHHRVAKDLWERVQLLMQGTSLTKHSLQVLHKPLHNHNPKKSLLVLKKSHMIGRLHTCVTICVLVFQVKQLFLKNHQKHLN
ncbi:hypothetical protein Tco_1150833 [Tanacetum coccineum]